ncbi:maleylpyruvate isomerase N-terminal domain-containing protein [Actinomadura montaniterrae]|uniref:Maleylpyruvate isomerase family mycothiol-dependent enzyme n=1 Tax=Actinomadura montaniterrae TaxID=1803903 RepID=A0A6L3W9F1_9ACTN|nr:maleylpyruvate isomerase N-terminal domain-containing protein [Actinomadura montaniterrae]KAB2388504.1 maleylpyruvate isomerase family mycothiol-dependent enzyme [Actinomadura montaniterrae]
MARTFADAVRWAREGTRLFLDAAGGLTEAEYDAPCLLPGWSRKHLVAHVAANADALGNLVHWAATGEETPMYASAEERAAGIERGPRMSGAELTGWLARSCTELRTAMDALTERQWRAEVVTAQGRTVPATEVPWMRSRETFVHAVDLDRGVSFADLPGGFLDALVTDIAAKRGLDALPDGPLPEVAAWLAGRPHALAGAPDLGPWL